jgi:acetate kinase
VHVVRAADLVLAINGGSSSIKFALFAIDDPPQRIVQGRIERIGLADARFVASGTDPADNFSRSVDAAHQVAAVDILMDWLETRGAAERLRALGHRVVHGGPTYSDAQQITPQLLDALRQLRSFDPLHLPQEILLIEACRRRLPLLPQVACFDTAFHHNLPRVAQLLPIPRRFTAAGVRRYGFHGLSYAFLLEQIQRVAGARAAQGRVVLAHLGSGASLAALHAGQPLDTSMGFTPASGVPMSTRSGDLDPGLVWYLAQTEKLDAERFNDLVNFESGLLGVSEITSDMRDLLQLQDHDVRAAEAISLFCYQIKKCVGAFAAVLGGLDMLVFSGGIGESAPAVRRRICERMEFLGIRVDDDRNSRNVDVISADGAAVTIRVMHTDEEWMIAKTVCRVLGF